MRNWIYWKSNKIQSAIMILRPRVGRSASNGGRKKNQHTHTHWKHSINVEFSDFSLKMCKIRKKTNEKKKTKKSKHLVFFLWSGKQKKNNNKNAAMQRATISLCNVDIVVADLIGAHSPLLIYSRSHRFDALTSQYTISWF